MRDWKRKGDANLESDGEHQHSENNRPKGPVPKHLQNTWHCHRCPQPSPERHRNADRDGVQAGSRGRVGGSPCYGTRTLGRAPGTHVTHRPLRHPEPCSATQTGDQSWDSDRDNLLLTAMSIEDTSHCTTCISGFLANLVSFCFLATLIIIISLQTPLQNAPVGTVPSGLVCGY